MNFSIICNLDKRVESEIIKLAKYHNIKKVILFGSRARGDDHEQSDIDLAVSGGDFTNFSLDLEDKVWTLLKFDVINLDKPINPKLLSEIEHDRIVLYEET